MSQIKSIYFASGRKSCSIRNDSGSNGFVLTTKNWVERTRAIGIYSKAGRYNSGTFAHKDIAFEFASWISVEFKLYLIKEFQRLKDQELKQLGWDIRRNLAKINHRIHTDRRFTFPGAASRMKLFDLRMRYFTPETRA